MTVPPIISSIILILCLTACHTKQHTTGFPEEERMLPDTLLLGYFGDRIKYLSEYDSLSASLVEKYGRRGAKGVQHASLDIENILSYQAYAEQPYFLGSNTWGKIILFKPTGTSYHSLQLYLLDESKDIKDAIEVGYAIDVESVFAYGNSIVTNQDEQIVIYTQSYWRSSMSTIDHQLIDSVLTDTIIAHKIVAGEKISMPLSKVKTRVLKELFVAKF